MSISVDAELGAFRIAQDGPVLPNLLTHPVTLI